MEMIGIIGGTGFKGWNEFEIENEVDKHTPWGTPSSPLYEGKLKGKKIVLLMRHGLDHSIPPHRINHRANIYALQEKADEIIGLCSAGALNTDMNVPSISIPKDYVNLWDPITFYDEKIKHVTPELSPELREELINAAEKLNEDFDKEGVYVQTRGPRLETKAEVDALKNFGDFVGMTMCPEATLAKESALEYAGITSIDNYANGVKGEEIEYEEIVDTAEKNWENAKKILEEFLEER